MDIELKDGKVYIGMKGQVAEAIEWGGRKEGKKPPTPASINLFDSGADEVFLER